MHKRSNKIVTSKEFSNSINKYKNQITSFNSNEESNNYNNSFNYKSRNSIEYNNIKFTQTKEDPIKKLNSKSQRILYNMHLGYRPFEK